MRKNALDGRKIVKNRDNMRKKVIHLPANRVPPHSIEAEEAVLGAMFLSHEAAMDASEMIRPEDFYRVANRMVFQSMQKLIQRNEVVDLVTVTEELRTSNLLEQVGGILYVTSLANAVPTAANLSYYTKIVTEKARLRELIQAATEIACAAFEESDTADEIADRAEQRILALSHRDVKTGIIAMPELVPAVMEEIDRQANAKNALLGLASGFPALDRMTSGFQASDLILLAARPSVGKTAFASNIAVHVAVHLRQPVMFFSLEMDKEQLLRRMIFSEGALDAEKFKEKTWSEADWKRYFGAADAIEKAPLYINRMPGLSVMQIRGMARRMKAKRGLSLVVIDYLQLIRTPKGRNETRAQEIASISRGLKELALELHVPVIALSQLNRAVEARNEKVPMLSDLRDSGALEQDADVVLFLSREDYCDWDKTQKSIAEVTIAKHRNGPVGSVKLFFDKGCTRFLNVTKADNASA